MKVTEFTINKSVSTWLASGGSPGPSQSGRPADCPSTAGTHPQVAPPVWDYSPTCPPPRGSAGRGWGWTGGHLGSRPSAEWTPATEWHCHASLWGQSSCLSGIKSLPWVDIPETHFTCTGVYKCACSGFWTNGILFYLTVSPGIYLWPSLYLYSLTAKLAHILEMISCHMGSTLPGWLTKCLLNLKFQHAQWCTEVWRGHSFTYEFSDPLMGKSFTHKLKDPLLEVLYSLV